MEYIGTLLSGLGTFLVGLAALLTLFVQYGYKKKAKDFESSLVTLLLAYIEQSESEGRMVLTKSSIDSKESISTLADQTGLNKKLIKQLLGKL